VKWEVALYRGTCLTLPQEFIKFVHWLWLLVTVLTSRLVFFFGVLLPYEINELIANLNCLFGIICGLCFVVFSKYMNIYQGPIHTDAQEWAKFGLKSKLHKNRIELFFQFSKIKSNNNCLT
jgi:hypothetical protein